MVSLTLMQKARDELYPIGLRVFPVSIFIRLYNTSYFDFIILWIVIKEHLYHLHSEEIISTT